MNDPQQIQQSWNFIAQAVNDFIRTLQPSTAEAMTAAVNHHFGVITPVIQKALDPIPPVQTPVQDPVDFDPFALGPSPDSGSDAE